MSEVLKFMSESPFLTFFLAVIILQTIITVSRAIANRNKPNCPCHQFQIQKTDGTDEGHSDDLI
jgi:hypothetical protein